MVDAQVEQTLPPHVFAAISASSDWVSACWPPGVVAALAVLTVVTWVRQRRRSRRAWPFAVLAAVLVLVCAATSLNSAVGYIPSVEAAAFFIDVGQQGGGHGQGRVSRITIPVPASRHLAESDTYVYTPPHFDRSGTTRYPVAYLVHGTPGTSADWVSGGQLLVTMDVLIDAGLIRPMIVVAPDLNAGAITDTECLDATSAGPKLASYLDTDVVGYIDRHYPTAADWQHRIIGGMSMGGYCALDHGLRNPQYGVILAIEPYDNPGAGGRQMLGPAADLAAVSPGHYLPTIAVPHPVAVFLDDGELARGGDSRETESVAAKVAARGWPMLYREEPGQGHTWSMARIAVPYGLVFAEQQMPAT